jgi:hypothetical protein
MPGVCVKCAYAREEERCLVLVWGTIDPQRLGTAVPICRKESQKQRERDAKCTAATPSRRFHGGPRRETKR